MTSRDSPLTFEQESIWIADQFAPDPSPYLETWVQHIRGPLDIAALEQALAQIVRRHPALRSRFLLEDADVVQRVDPDAQVALEHEPWPGGDLHEVLRRAGQRPLDLTRAPVRMTLYEQSPLDHRLLIQFHHVIVDDVALALLAEELEVFYTAAVAGRPALLPAPAVDLGDYARSQRAAGVDPLSLEYWSRHLDGVAPLPQLPPRRRPLPRQRGNGCDSVGMTLTPETGAAVRLLARQLRTTQNVIFTTCLALTVAATTGVEDVVLGTLVSRRGAAEVERLFGCLTDLLPLRLIVPPEASFADLCAAAKKNVIAGLRHRQVPYAAITRKILTSRAVLSGEHLARVVIVVDDNACELRLPALRCERVYVTAAAPKFDWCQYVVASGAGYLAFADYATDCFTPEEAQAALKQWVRTVEAVTTDPGGSVEQLAVTLAAME